ncbi:MAG: chlorite dismutase [Chloroflexota bacterium]
MAERLLSQFIACSLTPHYWGLSREDRLGFWADLTAALSQATPAVYYYQVFPARPDADFMVWCSVRADGVEAFDRFFDGLGRTLARFRPLAQPTVTLWGYTRPSIYAPGGRSSQDIDPFGPIRERYLVVYPFSKTTDWYLMSKDARQGMMNEHIRLGRQFEEVKQLLLYCTGLQDQEFVVAYETPDLIRFSELVMVLRSTEARRYTLRDTPILTGVYRLPDELAAIFG